MPQVNLSSELYAKLELIIKDSKEFKTVEAYAEYILKQVADKKTKETKQTEVYSKEDEEKIKQRLQNLGYLD